MPKDYPMQQILASAVLLAGSLIQAAEPLLQEPNTWVKRSPTMNGPVSPGLGYEASLGYDPKAHRVIRWGGHNQGGGGEQNAETWTFDLVTGRWALKEPNTSPPGVCCAQQNVFDSVHNRFLRFPAFSGNHGWHWFRENYLSNSTLWTYDLATNTWRDRRPVPAPRVSPLRCAAWDSDHQVVVIFGGEGNQEGTVVYDPYTNAWTRMNPARQPPFRSGGNLAYDAAHRLHVLFGAQFGDHPHTWAYDLRKNEWRDLQPTVQPPTDRNDAVLAYDRAHQVVIALVRVIDQSDKDEIVRGHLETWAYDAGKNSWTCMKPGSEPAGKGNRRRIMVAVPDQNLLLMENFINSAERVPGIDREQQIWTYRYADRKPDDWPTAPMGLEVSTQASGAELTWQSKDGAAGFAIYRGEGNVPWLVSYQNIATVGKKERVFRDSSLQPGRVYHYFVRSRDAGQRESGDSVKVRTQPRVVEDAVVSVLGTREVHLSWTPPPGPDIAGYHVERANVEVFTEDQITRLKKDSPPLPEPSVGAIKAIGTFQRLTKEPLRDTSYADTALDLSKPTTIDGEPIFNHRFAKEQLASDGKPYRYAVYAYRIRAVNHLGTESGAGPYFLTIPRSPQWLYSKETGASCELKWAANPEKGLQGYRVYRMESPRVNGPGQPVTRVTAAPVREMNFVDTQAGKETRRYWVVAVDTLGQEGIPSAPTWHYRQYRKFYEPFVREWHQ
jgi:hypothetical protein